MKERLTLHKPKLEELSYRQELLSQEETMGHRKGMEVKSEYYDAKTGCIDFPEEKWESWHAEFVDPYSNLYYAYILKDESFIGEASFYKSSDGNSYDISILIEAQHRRQGYGHEIFNQLLKIAFEDYDVESIKLMIDKKSTAAIKLCKKAGFKIKKHANKNIEMVLTNKNYFSLKQKEKMYS